jgi:hypothetical protein
MQLTLDNVTTATNPCHLGSDRIDQKKWFTLSDGRAQQLKSIGLHELL